MKHTLAILVENKPGVLTRVAGLFSRRAFNIESLAVGVTEKPDTSRMTIVVSGDEHVFEQVMKQLNKLIDVIRVSEIPAGDAVNRELALIKVGVDSSTRAEVMQIVTVFRAKIVDVGIKSLVIEITGDEDKINAMEQLLRQFGIKEMVRTGKIAINRGAKTVKVGK